MASAPAAAVAQPLSPDLTQSTPEDVTVLLAISGLRCAGCVQSIKAALEADPAIRHLTINLTTGRLTGKIDQSTLSIDGLIRRISDLGYDAVALDATQSMAAKENTQKDLAISLAVAGFAAANVMTFSVVVWFNPDLEPATRDLMHWLSAAIALPASFYSGQVFFRSAFNCLKRKQMNMDVPVSLAILLALAMSLIDTMARAETVYFDAAVSLVFFLLIGRYLDRSMRQRAAIAVENLLSQQPAEANIVHDEGYFEKLPIQEIAVGSNLHIAPGDTIPLDGVIMAGTSDIDASLLTGESLPQSVAPSSKIFAGTQNLTGTLTVRTTARSTDTLLADVAQQLENAQQSQARYVQYADRAARIYAPAVHILAALAFLGWLILSDATWQDSLRIAIAVLIVTCPCALGLAVPVVQVVANGRLFNEGFLLRNGQALERLGQIDRVLFDKTGTLSYGKPELLNPTDISNEDMRLAASLAVHSRHPLAKAIVSHANDRDIKLATVSNINEQPGLGIAARFEGQPVRLGKLAWALDPLPRQPSRYSIDTPLNLVSETWLRTADGRAVRFAFRDRIRKESFDLIRELHKRGYKIDLVSGDLPEPVRTLADNLGIDQWDAGLSPIQKKQIVDRLRAKGHHILMVGDGINDAPALAAATASIAIAEGADIAKAHADFVCSAARLDLLPQVLKIAQQARRTMLENFGLAFAYNCIAVPLACLGFASPLVAAIAMSSSSVLVTLNALKLNLR